MSTATDNSRSCLFGGGEGAALTIRGSISFGAGDVTLELALAMRYLEAIFFCPYATAPDAAENIYVDETKLGDGGCAVPSDSGTITVTRDVGTTAQSYFFIAFGR